jgi:hypothetical protein
MHTSRKPLFLPLSHVHAYQLIFYLRFSQARAQSIRTQFCLSRTAQYITDTQYPKPVVAYVTGRFAPQGKRMGHAGAIIMGKQGTMESKVDALSDAV